MVLALPLGQIAAVPVTTAIIAQSAAPGQLQAKVFVAFAALLVACLPVIARVPGHRDPGDGGRGGDLC